MTEKKLGHIMSYIHSLLWLNIGMLIYFLFIGNSYAERIKIYLQTEIAEKLIIEETFCNTIIHINDQTITVTNNINFIALILLVFNVINLVIILILSIKSSKKKLNDT
jgi:hypothetical protein